MNSKSKLLGTAVIAMAALSFAPQLVRAQGMMDKGMMDKGGEQAKEVAISGFCPVCVMGGMKVKGKDEFTTEYKGKVYKFAGFDQQKEFLNDPDKYVANLDTKFNALKGGGNMGQGNMPEEGSH